MFQNGRIASEWEYVLAWNSSLCGFISFNIIDVLGTIAFLLNLYYMHTVTDTHLQWHAVMFYCQPCSVFSEIGGWLKYTLGSRWPLYATQ